MKHYKSVFDNEQELIKALLEIHNNGRDIECDPMYFRGKFYQDWLNRPKLTFDLNPQDDITVQGNATNLPLDDNSLESIMLDPPFLICNRESQYKYYSSKTHTYFKSFDELYSMYEWIIKEAHRLLKNNWLLIFKCQDYTDSTTTMTHIHTYLLATLQWFYAQDLAILVKPNKVYNGNTTQRHLRKIHTYFYVFRKKNISN